jgi:hypothetical protein
MRIPVLAVLGALVLSSCSDVLNQQIVRAQVSAPSAPPLPILPLDESERLVVQAGIAQRLGSPPAGGPLTDTAGSNLQLSFDPQSFGGVFILHYKIFWSGLELSDDRTSVLLGVNVQNEDWKCLGYFGLGSTSFHQNLLLLQQKQDDLLFSDPKDTLVPLSGSISGVTTSVGISAMFTNGKVQPYLAIRFIGGPTVDGSTGSVPAAQNAFSLSQALVYAGVRGDVAPRLHLLAGAGWRTFTGGLIHGNDWNASVGASFDLGVVESHGSGATVAHVRPESTLPEPLDMTPEKAGPPRLETSPQAPRDSEGEIPERGRIPASVTPVGP